MKKVMFLLGALFTLCLAGCQPLSGTGTAWDEEDRLIGAYFTVTPRSAEAAPYEERIYATILPGETPSEAQYVFQDKPGLAFLSIPGAASDGQYRHDCIDAGIHSPGSRSEILIEDGKTRYETTLEGTLYVSADPSYFVWLNPVYQTKAGQVYLLNHDAAMEAGETLGSSCSQTYFDESSRTRVGASYEERFAVKAMVEVQFPLKSFSLYAMNEENAVLWQEDYTAGALPDLVTAGSDVSYLLLETRSIAPDGSVLTRVHALNRGAPLFTLYLSGAPGCCLARPISLIWQEGDPS